MWSWNLVNSPKQHNLQLCQIKNPFFVSPLPVTRWSHEGKVGISGAGVVRVHHGLGAVAGLRSGDADEVGDHQALEPKRGDRPAVSPNGEWMGGTTHLIEWWINNG